MQLAELNYWAILLAALSSFMLGGLWYSPVLFGKVWLEGCGLTDLDLQNSDPKLIYGLAFILSLIIPKYYKRLLQDTFKFYLH